MKKLVVHVSASDGRQGDGSPGNPLRSLTGVRDFIRHHRKDADVFEVAAAPGVYTVSEPLILEESDSRAPLALSCGKSLRNGIVRRWWWSAPVPEP